MREGMVEGRASRTMVEGRASRTMERKLLRRGISRRCLPRRCLPRRLRRAATVRLTSKREILDGSIVCKDEAISHVTAQEDLRAWTCVLPMHECFRVMMVFSRHGAEATCESRAGKFCQSLELLRSPGGCRCAFHLDHLVFTSPRYSLAGWSSNQPGEAFIPPCHSGVIYRHLPTQTPRYSRLAEFLTGSVASISVRRAEISWTSQGTTIS